MFKKDKLKEDPKPTPKPTPKTPYITPEQQQAMQQKPGNMFNHPPSKVDVAEHYIKEKIAHIEHNLRSEMINLDNRIKDLARFQATGVNKESWMKIIEDFLKPAIYNAISEKMDGKFNPLNQKVNQLYELFGLGNYDRDKKNIKNTMDVHLLELKKDLMRINFFRILFDVNEKEMRCLTKKVKKKIAKENEKV